MANGGRIDFTIGYKVDQTGLKNVETQLRELSKMTAADVLKFNPDLKTLDNAKVRLQEIQNTIKTLRTNFNQAFDVTTGTYNLKQLQQSLSQLNINNTYSQLKSLGPAGVQAFYDMNIVFNQADIDHHLLNEEFVVFDTETTGFYVGNDQMIEIGAVKIKNGEIIDRFDELINPHKKLPKKIIELTNINAPTHINAAAVTLPAVKIENTG